jgi:hypothetical protein
MGILIAHPNSPDYPFRRPPHYEKKVESRPSDEISTLSQEPQTVQPLAPATKQKRIKTRSKDDLRSYMLIHSLRGNKLSKVRQPFVGELYPLPSEQDPEVIFQIKRLGNQAVMLYRDKNSKVRYIMENDDDDDKSRMITEKDYPVGSMHIDVVELGLAGWNITDEAGTVVTLNRENILSYIGPDELDAIYEKVMQINPILSGESARKKS